MGRGFVKQHQDLEVYQLAFETAMRIFTLSKGFPAEEKYSLTDQVRRSSRSVCANLAEAWRKRIYQAAFVAKLTDCTAEASETQTWLSFALRCEYISAHEKQTLHRNYDRILGMLITMIKNPHHWLISQ